MGIFNPFEMFRMQGVFNDFLNMIKVHLVHEAVDAGRTKSLVMVRLFNQHNAGGTRQTGESTD